MILVISSDQQPKDQPLAHNHKSTDPPEDDREVEELLKFINGAAKPSNEDSNIQARAEEKPLSAKAAKRLSKKL